MTFLLFLLSLAAGSAIARAATSEYDGGTALLAWMIGLPLFFVARYGGRAFRFWWIHRQLTPAQRQRIRDFTRASK